MFADYVFAAVLMGTGFAFGWVWRSYVESKRNRERMRMRRVTGARQAVAREGAGTAVLRQARLTRGNIGNGNR